jgi:homoaconitase/3-isopropylmalate dehydratase large subunit
MLDDAHIKTITAHIKALADEKQLSLDDVDSLLRRWANGNGRDSTAGWRNGGPQTLSEQILSRASGTGAHAGDLVVVDLGRVMTIDSIAPEVIDVLEQELGIAQIPYPERCAIFIDHVAPAANVATAEGQLRARRFVREQGIARFYDAGCGICHQLMVEQRLVEPGMVAIGSDSHSTTYGAVAAFGTGMGTTDMCPCFRHRPYLDARSRDGTVDLSGQLPVRSMPRMSCCTC